MQLQAGFSVYKYISKSWWWHRILYTYNTFRCYYKYHWALSSLFGSLLQFSRLSLKHALHSHTHDVASKRVNRALIYKYKYMYFVSHTNITSHHITHTLAHVQTHGPDIHKRVHKKRISCIYYIYTKHSHNNIKIPRLPATCDRMIIRHPLVWQSTKMYGRTFPSHQK